ACKKHCATCCTRNVTMTTLEGYKIVEYMTSNGKTNFFGNIQEDIHKKRFQPELTTNALADLCVSGKDIPDEEGDCKWGACPLLTENECPIYTVRPFGCRCFVSTVKCLEKGYADVDPFVITVNNLFLQYIEHIDSQGCSGNLTDVLLFLKSKETFESYGKDSLNFTDSGLSSNRLIPVLLIPPEHQLRIQPILQKLHAIKLAPFGRA
ncbi:MAG: YkgJ family cysteine cluster protein, partial [Deltaproteobacteria bacterium]|nr:YkgJ family cysteine cluster protein [Deltaproteobacteria bacterium]